MSSTTIHLPRVQRSSNAAPTYRLTRRGRLVVFLAALFAVLAIGIVLASGSVATEESGKASPTDSVVVGPGDTLWDIADDATEGNVASMMEEIKQLNALESGALEAGQTLQVPIS